MNKGQVSIEWIVSFLFVLLVAFSVSMNEKTSFEEEVIAQKMHDLLIVWASEKENSIQEMQKDFEFFFGKRNALIEIENEKGKKEKIELGFEANEKEKIIEEISYYNDKTTKQKITLTVFH
jgi:uncharacterized protein (UPF0333 family)